MLKKRDPLWFTKPWYANPQGPTFTWSIYIILITIYCLFAANESIEEIPNYYYYSPIRNADLNAGEAFRNVRRAMTVVITYIKTGDIVILHTSSYFLVTYMMTFWFSYAVFINVALISILVTFIASLIFSLIILGPSFALELISHNLVLAEKIVKPILIESPIGLLLVVLGASVMLLITSALFCSLLLLISKTCYGLYYYMTTPTLLNVLFEIFDIDLYTHTWLLLGILSLTIYFKKWSYLGGLIGSFMMFYSYNNYNNQFFYNFMSTGLLAKTMVITIACYLAYLLINTKQPTTTSSGSRTETYFVLAIIGSVCTTFFTDNFMALIILIELVGFSSYLLAGFSKSREEEDTQNYKNGLIYFLINSIGTLLLFFALIRAWFMVGYLDISLTMNQLTHFILSNPEAIGHNGFMIALFLGILLKMGVAPMHFWLIKVYTSLANPHFLLLLLIPKFAYFRFLWSINTIPYSETLTFIMHVSIVASIIFGCLGLHKQTNLRLIFLYNALINNAFLLTPFVTHADVRYVALYLLSYNLSVLGSYGLLTLNTKYASLNVFQNLRDLNLLANFPMTRLWFTFAIINFISLPPMLGFFAKFLIIYTLFTPQLMILAILILLGTLYSNYAYIKFILTAWVPEE